MKKCAIVVLIGLMGVGILFAGGNSEPVGQEAGQKQLVLIVKEMNTDFWIGLRQGGADACEKYGIGFTCLSPERYSVELQIRIIEDMIQKDVDAFVVVPIDGNGIVSGIEKANEAGIPVMACNTAINGGETIGFAGMDHFSSGKALGNYFVKELDGKGNVVILEGTTGASSAQEILAGIHAAIDPYPEIKVLASTTAKYNRELAMKVMEDLLTRFDDIDAAICSNDNMALGAKEAIREANRSNILLGGINALPEAVNAVKEGEMSVTIDASGYVQGYVATELMCKYLLTGEKPPEETRIECGPEDEITIYNVEEFLKSRS